MYGFVINIYSGNMTSMGQIFDIKSDNVNKSQGVNI